MAFTIQNIKEFVYELKGVKKKKLLLVALNWIQNNMKPYDVFSYEQLEQWANDNGYIKPTP